MNKLKFLKDFGISELFYLQTKDKFLCHNGKQYYKSETPFLPPNFELIADCIEDDGRLKHDCAGGIPGVRTSWQRKRIS